MAATPELRPAPTPLGGEPDTALQAVQRRRLGPIPLADGYLLQNVVESSLRGLGWFAGLFLAFAIVTSAKKIAQDALPLSFVIELIGLQAPRIILFTIPASLLYGTVSTFTEMSGKGEITALMAGGMGLLRMLRGPLSFAALMAVFAFWLQEVVVPHAELRKAVVMAGAVSHIGVQENFKIVDMRSNGTIERIVQAEKFDPSTKVLVNPVIQLFRADKTLETEIKARLARWDPTEKAWLFENGSTVSNRNTTPGNETFSLPTHWNQLSLKTDVAPTLASLKSSARNAAEQIGDHNYEMVSWRDLAAHRSELEASYAHEVGEVRHKTGIEIRSATYGIHDKFATPLICLAMVFMAAPLGIRPQRTASAGLAMGLSLIVLILYYLVWTLATSWGKGGGQAPLLTAYLPFIVLMAIGSVLVARKS